MAVRSDNRLWVRKLDGDMHIVPEQPLQRLYPTNLDQVVESVNRAINPPLGGQPQARAIGSHWGISHTGVTTGYMIETATPVHEADGDQTAKRLNEPRYDVIPDCLTPEALRFFYAQNVPAFNPAVMPTHQEIYLFHVEAGMRIHELYALLDEGDAGKGKRSLADLMKEQGAGNDYSGPWALETMGGAGGQTIAGAFSTGTHGGDVPFGPLGDAVLAVHLVDADGEQHWIERTRLRPMTLPWETTMIDENKLKARFGATHDHREIQYHQDDNLMNAVAVACGRMGVIYSVVLRVVRQFALKETISSPQQWSDVKTWLTSPTAPIFNAIPANRFVKVDVSPYGGFWDPSRHDCYIVTRVLRELDAAGKGLPLGRAERGWNPGKGAPLGKAYGFFSRACSSDNWIREALDVSLVQIQEIRVKAIKAWLVAAAVIWFPLSTPAMKLDALATQQAAVATIVWAALYIAAIAHLIKHVISPIKIGFGDTLAAIANFCAHPEHFPIVWLPDLFPVFRAVYAYAFDAEHDVDPGNPRSPAISYAVMDEHDYLNVSCVAPGDSIEIFFDATDPKLVDFIDLVLIRVRQLENGELSGGPEAFGGYISLRFMAQSEAHIAMQKWPRTCSIEIAGLSRVEGTEPFLKRIEADAVDFRAVLHWGQRNNWSMKDVEGVYVPAGPWGALFKWRAALSELTDHGRYDVFSTDFSKQMGLEITDPIVGSFSVAPTEGCANEQTTIAWEAIRNPPETQAFLVIKPEKGNPTRLPLGTLSGNRSVTLVAGRSTFSLLLERELNGNIYHDQRDIAVRGFANNDEWTFTFTAEPRLVDGISRWVVEINLFSQFISNTLRVTEIHCTFAGVASWILRNPDVADLQFTTAQNHHILSSLPVFNKRWLFFSQSPASPGPNPILQVVFKLVCQH